jgi:hypothetical protein
MPPATELEIFNEPDWTKTHSHRVGLRSRDDRFPGLTHSGDDWRFVLEEEAEEKIAELKGKVERGELLTVRDFLAKQQVSRLDWEMTQRPGEGTGLTGGIGFSSSTAKGPSAELEIRASYVRESY